MAVREWLIYTGYNLGLILNIGFYCLKPILLTPYFDVDLYHNRWSSGRLQMMRQKHRGFKYRQNITCSVNVRVLYYSLGRCVLIWSFLDGPLPALQDWGFALLKGELFEVPQDAQFAVTWRASESIPAFFISQCELEYNFHKCFWCSWAAHELSAHAGLRQNKPL